MPCTIQEFIAKAVTLPGEGEIMDMMEVADPDAVHAVRSFIKKQLASKLKEEFLSMVYTSLVEFSLNMKIMLVKLTRLWPLSQVKNNRSSEQYEFDHPNMARRALKNISLGMCYLNQSLLDGFVGNFIK